MKGIWIYPDERYAEKCTSFSAKKPGTNGISPSEKSFCGIVYCPH